MEIELNLQGIFFTAKISEADIEDSPEDAITIPRQEFVDRSTDAYHLQNWLSGLLKPLKGSKRIFYSRCDQRDILRFWGSEKDPDLLISLEKDPIDKG